MTVVSIGEVVVDWISTVKGADIGNASSFWRCLGGNSTNVAVGVARLGSASRIIGKIGADIHGQYLKEQLRAEGVDLDFLLSDAKYPTAQCYCIHLADDDYSYYNWPFPNAAHMLEGAEISADAFAGAWLLHSTGISLTYDPRKTAVLHAMALAQSKGLLLSYDATFPTDEKEEGRKDAEQAVRMADLLKVNLQELIYWSGSKLSTEVFDLSAMNGGAQPPAIVFEEARALFHKYEPLVLLVTLGCAGSIIITSSVEVFCSPIKVEPVAPVGAGDAYIAGIIHGISARFQQPSRADIKALSKSEWQVIGRFANAAGALTTTRIGASEGLPRAAEVAAILEQRARR